MSQQIEAGSRNPEHEMIQEIRSLLAKMEKMSTEDLKELRIKVSVHRVETSEQLSRLVGLFENHVFKTHSISGLTMTCRTADIFAKLEVSFFYAFGLLDGEDVLTSTSHCSPRPFSIESIRVSESV
jgi:hypothetical protein